MLPNSNHKRNTDSKSGYLRGSRLSLSSGPTTRGRGEGDRVLIAAARGSVSSSVKSPNPPTSEKAKATKS